MDKRLIEETFPIKEVSFYSAKEKNIRHGHISTLHIWWARRPLAASRATTYASLTPAPETEKELEEEKKFIAEFSKWENTNNPKFIERARKKILKAYGGKPPKVLDPFGGGGSIPLECLRLGCETYSNDLNPVAVLIQKCTLDYPQRYGKPGFIVRDTSSFGKENKEKIKVDNVLYEDVKYWGDFVYTKVENEVAHFYDNTSEKYKTVGYIWARTVTCQNPACRSEIPLIRQFWLSNRPKKKVALYPKISQSRINFEVVGDGFTKIPNDFDPKKGTISDAIARCLICGSIINATSLKKIFQDGKVYDRPIAIILKHNKVAGKTYKVATALDYEIMKNVKADLSKKINQLSNKLNFQPLPDEEINYLGSEVEELYSTRCLKYGIKTWGDLFNPRQKLVLLTFLEKIIEVKELIRKHYEDVDYAKVIITYLALGLDRLVDYSSNLCVWHVTKDIMAHTFGRQSLPMTWDYFETNPFSNSTGNWQESFNYLLRVIENISTIDSPTNSATITQNSATDLPYPDNYFDAVITDPPYYDNINYAEISDFFYVWLKRILYDDYQDLFSTHTSPKTKEAVANPIRQGGKEKAKVFFESKLKDSFLEIYRVLKFSGIANIVYAHKTTEGWETLINSLLDSGLIISSAWPIDTEMSERLTAKETAALASSIYIMARKIERQPVSVYNTVREELKIYLRVKLDQLWNEGFTGADFFIAAIGSSIAVFSKYIKVIDFEGNQVRADRILQDVRVLVTDYAVRKILHNGFASEISDLTRFYILFRWEFGVQKVEFDEANKLAHSCHIDLAEEWTKKCSFINKDKEFISILGPQDRDIEDIEESSELIDVLHLSLKYWEKNRKAELNTLLRISGFGKSDAFFRVAQAIAETLPQDNKEKKLLEGFLNLREKIISTVSEPKTIYDQGKLEFPENE